MERDLLKQVIAEQRIDFLNKKMGVQRTKLKEAEIFLQLPHIYVITGIRRCGKSTFMRQIADKFITDGSFYFINFEDERLYNFDVGTFNQILEVQMELFGNHKTFIVDEIQNVPKFELVLRRLSDMGYKFIVSGSNAELLGGELATKITGRHVITKLQPFSFGEFLNFIKIVFTPSDLLLTETKALLSAKFEEYFSKGGMPEYLTFAAGEIITRMYEDILIKDIAVRNRITNMVPLRETGRYLITNFGRRYSYQSLKKAIGLGSVNTAISYTDYLEQSYLINNITKFDYSLKKQQAGEKKAYVTDHSIIRYVATTLMKDKGRILENIVANTLIAEHQLYFFADKNECDFVAVDANKNVHLFQVCAELNERNREREIAGLIEAMNYFGLAEAILLTTHQEQQLGFSGKTIQVLPIWKWMLIAN